MISQSSLEEYLRNLDLRSSASLLFFDRDVPIPRIAVAHGGYLQLFRDNPSTEAKNTKLLAVQNSQVPDAAYARRPLSLGGPPIAIYSPIFSKFRHLVQTVDLTAEDIRPTFAFVTASTEYYEDEQSRSEVIKHLLRVLVDGQFLEKGQISYGQRRAKPDGFSTHTFGRLMAAKGIHEMNNGLGESSSDALELAICDSRHFAFVTMVKGSTRYVAAQRSWLPSRARTFAWPGLYLQTTTSSSVAPQIAGSNAIDEGIRRIGKILKALKVCYQEHLPAFYDTLSSPPPVASSLAAACSPHLRDITLDGVVHELLYQRQLAPHKSSSAIFEATLKSPTISRRVVVKFTHSYGAAAHEILAAHKSSYAPALLYCQRHDHVGGLVVVIMDWCPDSPAKQLTPLAEIRLREAISLLHSADLVFGDLRPPNVMLNGDNIAIIDFDWAGKEGEVSYPIIINMNAITWPSGVDHKAFRDVAQRYELVRRTFCLVEESDASGTWRSFACPTPSRA
ncbi:hypothetical protein C8R45DRAFT_930490 [Mycena sanguinolenta]|nr:hypothetical protein C8R45DRAFT_930490 [Mycena sanguinolenta]